MRGQQSWDLAAASRVLRRRWSRMHTSLNSAQLLRREYRGMHSPSRLGLPKRARGGGIKRMEIRSECLIVDCGVLRASTARANCFYIALLYYERYHLRLSCSRYVNAARERRGRDIPSCSHLHRPYGSKTSGSPFTSLQAHEQEHRGHHALHGPLDHGPGLRLCLWLFHVRLPWIAPQS